MVFSHIAQAAAIFDGHRRSRAGRLAAYSAGAHYPCGAERHLGGADIPSGHHEVINVAAVKAPVGNRIHALKVQHACGQLVKIHDSAGRVFVHGPAAIGNGIIKYAVCTHIVFRQHIVAQQTAAFAVSWHHAHPTQFQVFRAMVAPVFDVVPHAVHAFK